MGYPGYHRYSPEAILALSLAHNYSSNGDKAKPCRSTLASSPIEKKTISATPQAGDVRWNHLEECSQPSASPSLAVSLPTTLPAKFNYFILGIIRPA